jgi:phenylalanyl-tRNA synthetase beta subunit
VQSYYGQGEKANVTLRFSYRAADRTLSEAEAKKQHEMVLQVLRG